MKVEFIPDAEADLMSAIQSYHRLQRGISDRILQEIGLMTIGIEQFPESYPLVTNRLRRVNLSVIPFQLYYASGRPLIPLLGLLPSRMYPPKKHRLLNRRLSEWDVVTVRATS